MAYPEIPIIAMPRKPPSNRIFSSTQNGQISARSQPQEPPNMLAEIFEILEAGNHGLWSPENPLSPLRDSAMCDITQVCQERQREQHRAELMEEQYGAESAKHARKRFCPAGVTKAKNHASQGQAEKGSHDYAVQPALAEGEAGIKARASFVWTHSSPFVTDSLRSVLRRGAPPATVKDRSNEQQNCVQPEEAQHAQQQQIHEPSGEEQSWRGSAISRIGMWLAAHEARRHSRVALPAGAHEIGFGDGRSWIGCGNDVMFSVAVPAVRCPDDSSAILYAMRSLRPISRITIPPHTKLIDQSQYLP
jgi:hypothetical protein